MARFTCTGIFLLLTFTAFSQRTTVASGNWSSAATWTGGIIPQSGDSVVINSGHSVTLTAAVTQTAGFRVVGTLNMAGFSFSCGSLSGTGTVNSSVAATLTVGTNNNATTFSGVIGSGAVSLVKQGTGKLTVTGSNTYTGSTRIEAGVLEVTGSSERLPNSTTLILAGGEFGINSAPGDFTETLGALQIEEDSKIRFSGKPFYGHRMVFAASNAQTWQNGKILSVEGWNGIPGNQSTFGHKLFIGTTASGLTPTQLAQVAFVYGSSTPNTNIYSSGEIIPNQPAPILWNGSVSSAWNVAANWTPAIVPTPLDSIVIASGTPFPAEITDSVTLFNRLTVLSGATLRVAAAGRLHLTAQAGINSNNPPSSRMTNAGNFDILSGGVIRLSSASAFSNTGNVNTFGRIIADNQCTFTNAALLHMRSGAFFEHRQSNNSVIPLATWDSTSTLLINGDFSGVFEGPTLTGFSGQSFGHLILEGTVNGNGRFNFAGQLTDVKGDFRIQFRSSGVWVWLTREYSSAFGGNCGPARTLTIGGDVFVQSGAAFLQTASISGVRWGFERNFSIVVYGNFYNYGSFMMQNDHKADCPRPTLTLAGVDKVIMMGPPAFCFVGGVNSTFPTMRTNLFINGCYRLLTPMRLFNVNLIVNGCLGIDTSAITGDGSSVTTAAGSTLYVSHPQGVLTGTTASGAIQVTGGRTFSPFTHFWYNGTLPQVTGNAIASVSKLTIDNPAGVSFSGEHNVTVTDSLRLLQGVLRATPGRILTVGSAGNAGGILQTNGWAAGQFRRFVPNGSVSNLLFPVGDSLNPAGVRLSFTGNTTGSGFMDITSRDSVPPRVSGIGPTRHIRQLWTITNGGVGGFSNWSAELNFSNADIVGEFRNQHMIRRLTSGSWNAVTRGSWGPNFTTATALTSTQFGDFYVGEGKLWNGSVSTDWNNAGNWTPSGVPDADVDITIPPAPQATVQPVLSTSFAQTDGVLTILSGAHLTVSATGSFSNGLEINNSGTLTNNGELRVGGSFVNTGTISSNSGAVEFYGNGAQSVPAALSAVRTLRLSGSGTKTLNGALASITDTLLVGSGTTLQLGTNNVGATTAPAVTRLYSGLGSGSVISGSGSMQTGAKVLVTYAGSSSSAARIEVPVTLSANSSWEVEDDGNAGTTELEVSTTISGSVNFTKSGSGTMLVTGSLQQTGSTTIAGGELRLNPSVNQNLSTAVILQGGALSTTGITSGRTITTTGTLNVSGADTLRLASGVAHTLSFANSSAEPWPGSGLLVTGWSGAYDGTAGTAGRIFVGSTAGGLTPAQLDKIRFFDGQYFYAANLLSTGELVPLANTITTGTLSASVYGAGATLSVPFTYHPPESFTATTTFTAQLSDASGSFTNAVDIGSTPGDGSGAQTITATIPLNTVPDHGYRIRVVSVSPSVTGTAITSDIEVKPPVSISSQPAATAEGCTGSTSPALSVTAGGSGTILYQWFSHTTNSNSGGTAIPGATQSTYSVPTGSGGTFYYYVQVSDDYSTVNSTVSVVTISSTHTWTGLADNNWNNAANWSACGVPSGSSPVVIASGAPNYPVISSGTVQAGSFTLQSGATVTVNGTGVLSLSGSIATSGGSLNLSSGTLLLSGSTAQTLPAGLISGDQLRKLIVNNAAGVTVQSSLTVDEVEWQNGKLDMGSGTLTVSGQSAPALTGYNSSRYMLGRLQQPVEAGTTDFPVGSATSYLGVTLSGYSGVSADVAMAWLPGDPSNNMDPTNTGAPGGPHPVTSLEAGLAGVSTLGQWDWQDFDDAMAGTTITVTLPALSSFSQAGALRLVGWDGTRWVNLSGSSGATGNTAGSTLSGTLVSGISALGIGTVAVQVSVKVFLMGAYNTSTGLMTTTLQNLNLLPLNQPYNTSPWNYSGTESVAAIPANVTDWVLVELRNASTPSTVIARRAAFILNTGMVVDLDGSSPVSFVGFESGNYHIAIRHRNHLSVRTATAQALSPTATLYDFTTAQGAAYQNPAITGNTALTAMGGGVFAMWGGDANSNGNVRASGPSNDQNAILQRLGGNTSLILTGIYTPEDLNLNGNVRYSGSQNDRNLLLNDVLGGQGNLILAQHL